MTRAKQDTASPSIWGILWATLKRTVTLFLSFLILLLVPISSTYWLHLSCGAIHKMALTGLSLSLGFVLACSLLPPSTLTLKKQEKRAEREAPLQGCGKPQLSGRLGNGLLSLSFSSTPPMRPWELTTVGQGQWDMKGWHEEHAMRLSPSSVPSCITSLLTACYHLSPVHPLQTASVILTEGDLNCWPRAEQSRLSLPSLKMGLPFKKTPQDSRMAYLLLWYLLLLSF